MPDFAPNRAYSVAELNKIVKGLLEGDARLQIVLVQGEISNFHRTQSTGHCYFTLKGDGAAVDCAMFRSSAARLPFQPQNGMKVLARGRVSLYEVTGKYQLVIDSLQPDGIGALYAAFEQLKRRLEGEGLFRAELKRPLPLLPSCVGVITSPTGAAVRDIIDVLGRRLPAAKVLLYPAIVQGDGAVPTLLAGIDYFSRSRAADVVIIGRGGGSIEDLWAFNDETLARAVRACSVPVISAVGHETDFTICDFAADARAATPSVAAELASGGAERVIERLASAKKSLKTDIVRRLVDARSRLNALAASRPLTVPTAPIDEKRLRLDHAAERLSSSEEKLRTRRTAAFSALAARLEALDPMAVLSRGYAAVFGANGAVVTSARTLSPGERLTLRLRDGSAAATVEEVTPSPAEEIPSPAEE